MTTRFTSALRNRQRDNEHKGDPDMSDPIPLSALVLEGLGAGLYGPPSVDVLEQRILDAGHPVIVDYIGRKCVSRDIAKILLGEHTSALEAQRQADEEHRLELARRGNPTIARVQAIAERQATSGHLGGLSAYEVMTADHHEALMDVSGRHMDEMLARDRDLTYHPIADREAN